MLDLGSVLAAENNRRRDVNKEMKMSNSLFHWRKKNKMCHGGASGFDKNSTSNPVTRFYSANGLNHWLECFL